MSAAEPSAEAASSSAMDVTDPGNDSGKASGAAEPYDRFKDPNLYDGRLPGMPIGGIPRITKPLSLMEIARLPPFEDDPVVWIRPLDGGALRAMQNAILQAASRGHHESIKALATRFPGVDINYADARGFTALMLASSFSYPMTIGEILAVPGCDVNKRDPQGATALTFAMMIENAKPNDGLGTTVYRNTLAVETLLAAPGIDVNAAARNGRTALHQCAIEGHSNALRLLLEAKGIDVNCASADGRTALIHAASKGRSVIVHQLLATPAVHLNATDAQGRTALMLAAGCGHGQSVLLLVAKLEVDVELSDEYGLTAADMAAKAKHKDIAQLLRQKEIEAPPPPPPVEPVLGEGASAASGIALRRADSDMGVGEQLRPEEMGMGAMESDAESDAERHNAVSNVVVSLGLDSTLGTSSDALAQLMESQDMDVEFAGGANDTSTGGEKSSSSSAPPAPPAAEREGDPTSELLFS